MASESPKKNTRRSTVLNSNNNAGGFNLSAQKLSMSSQENNGNNGVGKVNMAMLNLKEFSVRKGSYH